MTFCMFTNKNVHKRIFQQLYFSNFQDWGGVTFLGIAHISLGLSWDISFSALRELICECMLADFLYQRMYSLVYPVYARVKMNAETFVHTLLFWRRQRDHKIWLSSLLDAHMERKYNIHLRIYRNMIHQFTEFSLSSIYCTYRTWSMHRIQWWWKFSYE